MTYDSQGIPPKKKRKIKTPPEVVCWHPTKGLSFSSLTMDSTQEMWWCKTCNTHKMVKIKT
jgi:hypothetical protein